MYKINENHYAKSSYAIFLYFLLVKTFLMVRVLLFAIDSITFTALYADLDLPSSESNRES